MAPSLRARFDLSLPATLKRVRKGDIVLPAALRTGKYFAKLHLAALLASFLTGIVREHLDVRDTSKLPLGLERTSQLLHEIWHHDSQLCLIFMGTRLPFRTDMAITSANATEYYGWRAWVGEWGAHESNIAYFAGEQVYLSEVDWRFSKMVEAAKKLKPGLEYGPL